VTTAISCVGPPTELDENTRCEGSWSCSLMITGDRYYRCKGQQSNISRLLRYINGSRSTGHGFIACDLWRKVRRDLSGSMVKDVSTVQMDHDESPFSRWQRTKDGPKKLCAVIYTPLLNYLTVIWGHYFVGWQFMWYDSLRISVLWSQLNISHIYGSPAGTRPYLT
jgi:hypothetical protein